MSEEKLLNEKLAVVKKLIEIRQDLENNIPDDL